MWRRGADDVGVEEHSPPGATRDAVRGGRAGRRLSVWHFLVAIAILPTLCLPILAGLLTQERLVSSASASRLERDLLSVTSVDRLRHALAMESSVEPFTALAAQYGFSPDIFSRQLGWNLPSQADAEAATDSALADLSGVTAFEKTRDRMRAELPPLRAAVAKAAGGDAASLAPANVGYMNLLNLVTEVEQSLAHRVGRTDYGGVSARLRARINSFDAICEVVIGHMRGSGNFYRIMLAEEPEKSDVDGLVRESKRYQVLSERLSAELDPESAERWNGITSSDKHRIFVKVMSRGPAAIPGGTALRSGKADIATLVKAFPPLQAVLRMMEELTEYLRDAAVQTAAIARSEARGARLRAMATVGSTGVVVVLTTLALLLLGGTLRRRLARVAEGAQRLSAGHLDLVQVVGPRELAATSEALNAAVSTLRHVEAKAVLLASGDLDSAELEQPAPGPLGAAVDASVSRIVVAVREREELRLQLAHQASHDGLTGLPNRSELDRVLRAVADRAERDATPISVLFVDLDGFKACNDRYGHAIGDLVLERTAQRLREVIRPGDVVGRFGGDEFVVIVEGVSPGPDVVQIGQRIIDALSRPIVSDLGQITIGTSVGVAGCSHGEATAEQLLSQADAAVYRAKASGRGCVVVFDEQLRTAPTGSPPHGLPTPRGNASPRGNAVGTRETCE